MVLRNMKQAEHEKHCEEQFGKAFSRVHAFLDQYATRFRGINHRRLLHHRLGVERVVAQFGEEARGPAEQHIQLDFGFVPENLVDIDDYYFPLTIEEDDEINAELERLYAGRDA